MVQALFLGLLHDVFVILYATKAANARGSCPGKEFLVEKHEQSTDRPETGPMVSITVNGKAFAIHRGSQTVLEIKTVGGVPVGHDLEQVVDGRLVPLPDDGRVTIKGGEVFQSHPKDGASA